jgi:uncharacterized protein YciI
MRIFIGYPRPSYHFRRGSIGASESPRARMPLYVRLILCTGAPEQVRRAAEEHLQHLAQLRHGHKLRAAGKFPDEDGFLEIFEARDRLEAEAIARASALVERGLCTWMLREWRELA